MPGVRRSTVSTRPVWTVLFSSPPSSTRSPSSSHGCLGKPNHITPEVGRHLDFTAARSTYTVKWEGTPLSRQSRPVLCRLPGVGAVEGEARVPRKVVLAPAGAGRHQSGGTAGSDVG